MKSNEFGDLAAFVGVAEERSFTCAAAKLGVSQSALSFTVRRLEERLGLRLLSRTTRSVAPTEAGERLLRTLRPAFEQIDSEVASLGELRDTPSGTIRITANDHAADTLLWPAIAQLLPAYPDIKVEINVDYGLTDIVTEQYDAGVRFGDQVAKDTVDRLVRALDAMRIAAGVSKADLARSISAKPEIVRRLFTSRGSNPTLATFAKLAAALGQRIALVPVKPKPAAALTSRKRARAETADA